MICVRNSFVAIVATLAVAGCATQTQVRGTDNFLTQAGFTQIDRGDPAFATVVKNVHPHRFGHRTVNGVATYYYFDPTICGCVYRGTAQDWEAYRALVADRMHMHAEMLLEDFAMPSDSGGG